MSDHYANGLARERAKAEQQAALKKAAKAAAPVQPLPKDYRGVGMFPRP